LNDLQKIAPSIGAHLSAASGFSVPGATMGPGQRYVGPSLQESAPQDSKAHYETQLLTSDGSIDLSNQRSTSEGSAWSARAASREGGSESGSYAVSKKGGIAEDNTEVLTAAYVDYSLVSSEVDHLSKPSASEPLLGTSDTSRVRVDFRDRHARHVDEFPVSLLEESHNRLRVLDLMTLVLAAFIGIGCGFLFLRVFAPSLLEKLNYFGGA
jgi:hypothetical protein